MEPLLLLAIIILFERTRRLGRSQAALRAALRKLEVAANVPVTMATEEELQRRQSLLGWRPLVHLVGWFTVGVGLFFALQSEAAEGLRRSQWLGVRGSLWAAGAALVAAFLLLPRLTRPLIPPCPRCHAPVGGSASCPSCGLVLE